MDSREIRLRLQLEARRELLRLNYSEHEYKNTDWYTTFNEFMTH